MGVLSNRASPSVSNGRGMSKAEVGSIGIVAKGVNVPPRALCSEKLP